MLLENSSSNKGREKSTTELMKQVIEHRKIKAKAMGQGESSTFELHHAQRYYLHRHYCLVYRDRPTHHAIGWSAAFCFERYQTRVHSGYWNGVYPE
jgi:hypothetical protein